jgi:hypothetical protein
VVEEFKEYQKSLPPDKNIRQMFYELRQWRKYK